MATQQSIEKAAQAWCKPTTEHLVMVPELAEAFAEILDEQTERYVSSLKALQAAFDRIRELEERW